MQDSMLALDSTAFVEALELPASERLQARRKRQGAKARLELARLMEDVHALADELEEAQRALRTGDYSELSVTRRLRTGRRPRALEEEVEAARRRLAKAEAEVEEKRVRAEALERDAREPDRTGRVEEYRLHSASHYVSCSRARYDHLSAVQRTVPVCLSAREGRRWWWYQDRFWWADARLGQREIESMVLAKDLSSQGQREAFERAQDHLTGRSNGASAHEPMPDEIRREVWIRDRGRCVDCGEGSGLAFDYVLPPELGGANTTPNIELRCRACQTRRRANEDRATVGKARIGAYAAKEWGVELKDVSWPRGP